MLDDGFLESITLTLVSPVVGTFFSYIGPKMGELGIEVQPWECLLEIHMGKFDRALWVRLPHLPSAQISEVDILKEGVDDHLVIEECITCQHADFCRTQSLIIFSQTGLLGLVHPSLSCWKIHNSLAVFHPSQPNHSPAQST